MTFHTDDDIRVRAYHLWEAEGRPAGRDLEFWQRAEQTLTVAPAKKTTRRAPRAQAATVTAGTKATKATKRPRQPAP